MRNNSFRQNIALFVACGAANEEDRRMKQGKLPEKSVSGKFYREPIVMGLFDSV